jgi:plasmid replication initiation protein
MNSSYDLSLEEQKIILTLASMVQPNDEEFKAYNFRIADFMQMLGVEDKSKYTEIPKITKELMKKVLEIQEDNALLQVAWLNSARYEKGSGMVTLKFSPDLKPYMLKLSNMFTQYKLANILCMKSKYSPRIYEILKCNEFRKQGYIEIQVDELRKLLRADNIYPLYNDFKRYVIERTQKELKKLSDISFEFEEVKTGRKVTSLRFLIHSNRSQITTNVKALDEVSVTVSEDGQVTNIEEGTREVLKILQGHKVNPLDALEIYKNANGDLRYIKKVYEYSKTQKNIKSLIGFMKQMVKPGILQENIRISKVDNFNNFEQRESPINGMNMDELERKLLGWELGKDTTGEEYEQATIKVE